MKAYRFSILTPDRKHYAGDAVSVIIPGADGQLTVLAQHTPMVALLVSGSVIIRTEDETLTGRMGPGILRVDREETVALVRDFHWDGDESEAEVAVEAARGDGLLL